jgi:phage tail-like protein
MAYLPEIYQQDEFIGRYLLIFESLFAPLTWIVDNFDMYLSPEVAPANWLQWMAGWFDLLLLPDLPEDTQRRIMDQVGWLYLRRGTPAGLARLLELYFGVVPEIIEDEPCHFEVVLPLSESTVNMGREVAERLIESQRPAFASYTLTVT